MFIRLSSICLVLIIQSLKIASFGNMIMSLPNFRFLQPLIMTSVLAGLILFFMTPFGTNVLPVPVRLAYWVGFCIAGGLGAAGLERVFQKILIDASVVNLVLVRAVGASIAVTILLIALSLYLKESGSYGQFFTLFLKVMLISVLICGADIMLRADAKQTRDIPSPRILERIKPELRNSVLYALSAEDHYVRVYTASGDDLILLRLSDAIEQVAPLSGLSPHRSWWVADAGKIKTNYHQGKYTIILKNGKVVPVSRNRIAALKEAHWL